MLPCFIMFPRFDIYIYTYIYIYIVCKVYFIQVTCRETFLLAKALVKASQKFTFGVTKGLWIFRINRTIGMEVMNFSPKAKLLNLFEAEPKPICVPPLLKVSKKLYPVVPTVQDIFCLQQLDLGVFRWDTLNRTPWLPLWAREWQCHSFRNDYGTCVLDHFIHTHEDTTRRLAIKGAKRVRGLRYGKEKHTLALAAKWLHGVPCYLQMIRQN